MIAGFFLSRFKDEIVAAAKAGIQKIISLPDDTAQSVAAAIVTSAFAYIVAILPAGLKDVPADGAKSLVEPYLRDSQFIDGLKAILGATLRLQFGLAQAVADQCAAIVVDLIIAKVANT